MSEGATVYLVDDDASFLVAQSRMLRWAGLDVCECLSGAQLLAQVSAETRGCVVTDLSMPGMSGLELQVELANLGAVLPIVFLTGHGSIPSSVRAMRAGAVDFLEKNATCEALLAAIGRALASDAANHEGLMRAAELRKRFSRLTARERQVLHHVVSGGLNKQIAGWLGIHERTVKLHRQAIVTKLGVHSTAQLATMVRDARVFDNESWPMSLPACRRVSSSDSH